MRTLERTSTFKRDYKRIKATPKHRDIDALFVEALKLLITDSTMPEHYRDHPLIGDWKDHRDCHIKPDLVLIYKKPNAEVLQLVRIGSHSQLGF